LLTALLIINPKKQALKYVLENEAYTENANERPCLLSAGIVPGYGRASFHSTNAGWITDVKPAYHLMHGMAELEKRIYAEHGDDPTFLKDAMLTKELTAAFLGGVLAEEVVQHIISGEDMIGVPMHMKFGQGRGMFDPLYVDDELTVLNSAALKEMSALLGGVGAVGGNTMTWLARMGLGRIDSLDMDRIEEHNIPRTLIYHACDGMYKADAATDIIRRMSGGNTHAEAIIAALYDGTTPADSNVSVLPEDWVPETQYDVAIDGFDNFLSRNLVHRLGTRLKMPVVSASGRHDGLNAETYIPDETLCLDCNIQMERRAKEDAARRRQSCGLEITPQGTWFNQAVGALVAMKVASIADPYRNGEPINGIVAVDVNQPDRVSIIEKEGACYHTDGGMEHNV